MPSDRARSRSSCSKAIQPAQASPRRPGSRGPGAAAWRSSRRGCDTAVSRSPISSAAARSPGGRDRPAPPVADGSEEIGCPVADLGEGVGHRPQRAPRTPGRRGRPPRPSGRRAASARRRRLVQQRPPPGRATADVDSWSEQRQRPWPTRPAPSRASAPRVRPTVRGTSCHRRPRRRSVVRHRGLADGGRVGLATPLGRGTRRSPGTLAPGWRRARGPARGLGGAAERPRSVQYQLRGPRAGERDRQAVARSGVERDGWWPVSSRAQASHTELVGPVEVGVGLLGHDRGGTRGGADGVAVSSPDSARRSAA